MKKLTIALVAAAFAATVPAHAAEKADAAKVDAIVKTGWTKSNDEWKARLEQDPTMKACSATRNSPDKDVAEEIKAAALASIKYPEDGKLTGDWKNGEKLAQSGYGMRFTDYPADRPIGGNCYACHQLDKKEVSYGTIGPSLTGYGKLRDFTDAAVKAAYQKIYNSHVAFPCSNMPRFGTNGILTIEQIKDLTALLMDKESPVNK